MFWKKNDNKIEEKTNIGKTMKMVWRGFSATDIGMVRSQNEDAVFLSLRFGEKEFLLAIVCDGMGGHSAGHVASILCVNTITSFLKDKTPNKTLLKEAILAANSAIYNHALENPEHKGMGTTCSAMIVFNNNIHWAHVGDSHIYLIDEKINLINEDHTLEFQKNKDGLPLLPGDEHVLTMAMGTKPTVHPDFGSFKLKKSKEVRFLLCTDGLYNLLSEEELLILGKIIPASLSAQSLIAMAKERGGPDNISVCILDHLLVQGDDKQTISE